MSVTETPSATSIASGTEAKFPKKYRARKPISETEKVRKRTAFLERNRVAAGKCRSRKKDWVEKMEEDARAARATNTALKAEHLVLLGEVKCLRALVATCDDECKQAEKGKAEASVEPPTQIET